jgi:acetyltransferase-like isoleucine patch superfamily enzyme
MLIYKKLINRIRHFIKYRCLVKNATNLDHLALVELRMRKQELHDEHNINNPIKADKYVDFGDYTYGNPRIIRYESGKGTTCRIGKFCSIGENVVIMLGGNHKYHLISTYPFSG